MNSMHKFTLVSQDSDASASEGGLFAADATQAFDEWVDELDHEDQQKNAIMMTYHAIHMFNCMKMEAYKEQEWHTMLVKGPFRSCKQQSLHE